jgi:hypothetical protein
MIKEDAVPTNNDLHVAILNLVTGTYEVLEDREKREILNPQGDEELSESNTEECRAEEDFAITFTDENEEADREDFESCTIEDPRFSNEPSEGEIFRFAGMNSNDEGATNIDEETLREASRIMNFEVNSDNQTEVRESEEFPTSFNNQ